MERKLLVTTAAAALLILIGAAIYRAQSLEEDSHDFENIPQNPPSQVCTKISQPGDVYHCLAVVNQDATFCEKMGRGEDKSVCLALANKDLSVCQEIKDNETKQMCHQELSFKAGQIDYCDSASDPDQCYFSFIHRLYWRRRSAEIQDGYCQKLSANAGGNLAYRDTCWALKDRDPALCQGNEHCLSFFEQPLSFCVNNKLKSSEDDCLRDRALTSQDPALCERIGDEEIRDRCYGSYSAHIAPDLALCEKITGKMTSNACYTQYASNLAEE